MAGTAPDTTALFELNGPAANDAAILATVSELRERLRGSNSLPFLSSLDERTARILMVPTSNDTSLRDARTRYL